MSRLGAIILAAPERTLSIYLNGTSLVHFHSLECGGISLTIWFLFCLTRLYHSIVRPRRVMRCSRQQHNSALLLHLLCYTLTPSPSRFSPKKHSKVSGIRINGWFIGRHPFNLNIFPTGCVGQGLSPSQLGGVWSTRLHNRRRTRRRRRRRRQSTKSLHVALASARKVTYLWISSTVGCSNILTGGGSQSVWMVGC